MSDIRAAMTSADPETERLRREIVALNRAGGGPGTAAGRGPIEVH